ncbi:hypothetical protein EMIT0180MI3_360032 [Priestia megaterium]
MIKYATNPLWERACGEGACRTAASPRWAAQRTQYLRALRTRTGASPLATQARSPIWISIGVPNGGSTGLRHIDDDFFLPLLRQRLGGLFPRVGVFDRRDLFVLFVRQQLGLDLFRQSQMLGANWTGVAFCQVDLASVAEDVFAGQFGGVRVLGVFVDDGGVAGNHRAIGWNQHGVVIRIRHLGLVAQAVEVPDHADFDFTLFHGGDRRVGHGQAALLGDVCEQQQGWLNVFLVTAIGEGGGQYAVGGLGCGAYVTDGDFVLAALEVGPFGRCFGTVQQLFIDDERDGAGVSQRPVTVLVLGPIRNLCPSTRLVRLHHALLDRDRAEGGTDVADVGCGVVFFGGELGDFLGRAHVGVDVFQAVFLGQVFPSAFPVGPVIGHADAVDGAFRFRSGFECFQIGIRRHGGSAQGNGRA